MLGTQSNHFKYQKNKKLIDLSADTVKIILMNTTFSFNEDTHATLADVTADQLATGNGYTQDNKILANQALAEDDANNRSAFTCDDVIWTADGGSFGPIGAAIIYDDTTADDTVIGCIDFGQDYTISDGSDLKLKNIAINDS